MSKYDMSGLSKEVLMYIVADCLYRCEGFEEGDPYFEKQMGLIDSVLEELIIRGRN